MTCEVPKIDIFVTNWDLCTFGQVAKFILGSCEVSRPSLLPARLTVCHVMSGNVFDGCQLIGQKSGKNSCQGSTVYCWLLIRCHAIRATTHQLWRTQGPNAFDAVHLLWRSFLLGFGPIFRPTMHEKQLAVGLIVGEAFITLPTSLMDLAGRDAERWDTTVPRMETVMTGQWEDGRRKGKGIDIHSLLVVVPFNFFAVVALVWYVASVYWTVVVHLVLCDSMTLLLTTMKFGICTSVYSVITTTCIANRVRQ